MDLSNGADKVFPRILNLFTHFIIITNSYYYAATLDLHYFIFSNGTGT